MTNTYEVEFKLVFSQDRIRLQLKPSWTYNEFVSYVTPILSNRFGIIKDELEIVESGQYIPGVSPEYAPAINPPSIITIGKKWGETLTRISFYVRKQQSVEQREAVEAIIAEEARIQEQANIEMENRVEAEASIARGSIEYITELNECPICYEPRILSIRFQCVHRFCSRCFNRCQVSNGCPCCRAPVC